MNSKPLCIACIIVCFITACLTEGNVLTFGQALIVMLIAGALSIWNGAQKEKAFIRLPSDKGTNKKAKNTSIKF